MLLGGLRLARRGALAGLRSGLAQVCLRAHPPATPAAQEKPGSVMPGREHILVQRINSAALDSFIAMQEWEDVYSGLMGLLQLYRAAYPLVRRSPPVMERGCALCHRWRCCEAGTHQNVALKSLPCKLRAKWLEVGHRPVPAAFHPLVPELPLSGGDCRRNRLSLC